MEITSVHSECYYCEQKLFILNRTVDHVIPLSKGGKDLPNNKVYACKDCNSSKRDYSLLEWKEWLIKNTSPKKLKNIVHTKERIIQKINFMIEVINNRENIK